MWQVVGRAEKNHYKPLVKVLYCKLPSNSKQLSAFQHEVSPM